MDKYWELIDAVYRKGWESKGRTDYDPRGTTEWQDAVDAFDDLEHRLAAAEAKLPKWIPVKERLPKPGATILAVDNSGDMGVCAFVNARFVGECFGFEVYLNDGGWDRSASKVIGEYITHWMPLPEPPNNGENAG